MIRNGPQLFSEEPRRCTLHTVHRATLLKGCLGSLPSYAMASTGLLSGPPACLASSFRCNSACLSSSCSSMPSLLVHSGEAAAGLVLDSGLVPGLQVSLQALTILSNQSNRAGSWHFSPWGFGTCIRSFSWLPWLCFKPLSLISDKGVCFSMALLVLTS